MEGRKDRGEGGNISVLITFEGGWARHPGPIDKKVKGVQRVVHLKLLYTREKELVFQSFDKVNVVFLGSFLKAQPVINIISQ